MQQEDLKTLGAVEMVLGLLDVSLGAVLLQVQTFFRKEIFVVFISGVWTVLTGFSLLCGGRKPSYACMRFNVTFHLPTLIFSAVAFGTLVRHVPYRQSRYCTNGAQHDLCNSVSHGNMVVVGGILAILITNFLVETLISLVVILTGLCSMFSDSPQQSEDPECIGSTTSKPLCPPPQQLGTPEGEDTKTDS